MRLIDADELEWPKAELCKTCIHTRVCERDKNLVGDVYVAPNPWFFDEEYKQKTWEDFKRREAEGFPCDEYQPTIDPVKHGRWEKLDLWTKPVCSVCGKPCFGLHGFSYETTDYCPNCGARMEGEEDE